MMTNAQFSEILGQSKYPKHEPTATVETPTLRDWFAMAALEGDWGSQNAHT